MARQSDVPCPVCGCLLKQPSHTDDWHDWDCHRCQLEIPDSIRIDGRDIIEALRRPELRPLIRALLPAIDLPDNWLYPV